MTNSQLAQWALHHRPKPKDWDGGPFVIAEQKLDGWRATLAKELDGTIRVLGRRGLMGDQWPQLRLGKRVREFAEALPNGTVLDCEMYVPEKSSSQVPTALRFPLSDEIRLTPFAVPFFNGTDLTRVDFAEAHAVLIDEVRASPPPQLTGYKFLGVSRFEWQCAELKNMAMKIKCEGFVLKNHHWLGPWWKVKPVRTADLVVTGFKPGTPGTSNAGLVGSLEVSARTNNGSLFHCGNASGMNARERAEMTEMANDGTLCTRVAEIAYDTVGARGRLRFPRFLRWRPDRDPASATRVTDLR